MVSRQLNLHRVAHMGTHWPLGSLGSSVLAELSTPQVCHAKAKLGVLWPEVLQQRCQRWVGQLGSLPIQALGQVIMAIGAMLRA